MAPDDAFDENPFASPESDFQSTEITEFDDQPTFAEFGTRFAAAFIDGLIVNLPLRILDAVVTFQSRNVDEFEPLSLLVSLLSFVVPWLYSALQESSPAQATLGKRAMGIKVTDLYGNRISFMRATGRHFGKLLSLATLFIGYLMQQFTSRRQALHDIMAGCLVVVDPGRKRKKSN